MNKRRALVAVIFAAAGLSACTRGDAIDASDLPTWQLVEDLRIGAVDGGDQNLTRVTGLLPLPDGSVWIMQPDDHQFRIYDEAGAFTRTVGVRGEAPGEFVAPMRLGWWGSRRDTIWVQDGTRRISLFTTAGEFIRAFERQSFEYEQLWSVPRPDIILPDGTALGVASKGVPEELSDFRIVHYHPETGPVYRAIAVLERGLAIRAVPTAAATVRQPIPDHELFAYAPDGAWLVIADRRAEGLPEIGRLPLHAIGIDGDTLWSRHLLYQPQPILREELDTLEVRRDRYRDFLVSTAGWTPAAAEERSQLISQPGHRPPAERIIVGQDDRIWLEWAAPPLQAAGWVVISGAGQPLATLAHQGRIDVLAADAQFLWVLELDALDVPYVVRYQLAERN